MASTMGESFSASRPAALAYSGARAGREGVRWARRALRTDLGLEVSRQTSGRVQAPQGAARRVKAAVVYS